MLTKPVIAVVLLCCATTLASCGQAAPQNTKADPAPTTQVNQNLNSPAMNTNNGSTAPNIENQLDQRIAEPAQTSPSLNE